jgi:hypothetical protein
MLSIPCTDAQIATRLRALANDMDTIAICLRDRQCEPWTLHATEMECAARLSRSWAIEIIHASHSERDAPAAASRATTYTYPPAHCAP